MLCAASYRFCESPAQATGSELALPSVCSAFVLSCLTFVTCVFLVYFLGFAAHSRVFLFFYLSMHHVFQVFISAELEIVSSALSSISLVLSLTTPNCN